MKINFNKSELFYPLSAFFVFLTTWQMVCSVLKIPMYVLPSPINIFAEFKGNGTYIWNNYLVTFIESFLGLLIGSLFGFTMGCIIAESIILRKIYLPFLIASNAIPVVAIAPIILIWFGPGLVSKVVVTAFISFFPIALNTFKGLTEFVALYKDLFTVYGSSKFEFFYKFKLGNATHYIFTGLKLNATLAPIGAIVAEFISADKGVGFAIMQANYSNNSSKLWGYIILACSIGIIFYLIVSLIESVFFKKYKTK